MKKYIHALSLMGMTLMMASPFCQAQSLEPTAVNAGGGTKFISNIRHDFSFGEAAVINTSTDIPNDLIITQGLLQPESEPIDCGSISAGIITQDTLICDATANFEIKANNATVYIGIFQSGQWEMMSPVSSGIWSELGGETDTILSISGVTQSAKYRYKVNCTLDGNSVYSGVQTTTYGVPSATEIIATSVSVPGGPAGGYTFEVTNAENIISYDWDFGDNHGMSFDPNPTYFYPSPYPQDYTVKVFLEGECETIVLSLFMSQVLPVKASDLTASLSKDNKARLTWTTFMEQYNKGFNIQKSKDGKDFKTIDFISSKAEDGTSRAAIEYLFEDKKSLMEPTFYRYQQEDLDGKIMFSNIVFLEPVLNSSAPILSGIPNPVKDRLQLTINTSISDQSQLIITDTRGKEVLKFKVTEPNMSVSLEKLSSGTYIVQYVDAQVKSSIKIIKE